MKIGWKVGAIGLAAIAGACVAVGIWRWSFSIEQAIGDFALALGMLALSFVVLSIGAPPNADKASLGASPQAMADAVESMPSAPHQASSLSR